MQRPISPHLSIYKLQLTSGLSILHRITGFYLYCGLILFAWLLFATVYFPDWVSNMSECIYGNFISRIISKLMVLGWAFSLFYHSLNGIRHLFWDIGKGFEIKLAYLSGRIVIVSALLLTIVCWLLVSKNTGLVLEETIIIEEKTNE